MRMLPVWLLLVPIAIFPAAALAQSSAPTDEIDRILSSSYPASTDGRDGSRAATPSPPTTLPAHAYSPDMITSGPSGTGDGGSAGLHLEVAADARAHHAPKPGEFEALVARKLGRSIPRFGSSLFFEDARGFTPGPAMAVPPDYILNPGDELIIGLTGSIEASDLRVTIDKEGRIFLPHVGAISVAGRRYGELPSLLNQVLGRQYRDFKVAVGLGRLHGIRVYVTGFAENPGAYTLSSLSTLANGVLAAGGPSAAGSFRSIQLRRGGRIVASLDLYDLLLRGDKTRDAVLQNEDVLYVAPVGAEVALTGSVNAEAIYEVKSGEVVGDLLAYAGGLSTVADTRRVLVWRLAGQDKAGWEELPIATAQAQPIEGGDIFRVLSAVDLVRPQERQAILATIDGEVDRPGQYFLNPGSTIGDLLAKAGGLTDGAFIFGTELDRFSVAQQERANFERAIRELEFMLMTKAPDVSRESENSASAASAKRAAAASAIEQLRKRSPSGRLVLSLSADASRLPKGFVLEDNDRIHIPTRPTTVGVFGAVYQSGSFLYRPGKKLRDYLQLSGGIEKMADPSGIFVVRLDGSVIAAHSHLLGAGLLDETALPGDVIFVPIQTEPGAFWEHVKSITQVLYQTAFGAASLKVLTQ